MNEKSTNSLEQILMNTHSKDAGKYLADYSDSMLVEDKPFASYMRQLIKEKNLRQQDIFIQADVPERYGYKLLSEEKHTRQRDVILRICYAAHFTLAETQKALKIYGMPQLYAKISRDAMLMIAFNERKGSVLEVNVLLKKQGMEMLRTSGIQE